MRFFFNTNLLQKIPTNFQATHFFVGLLLTLTAFVIYSQTWQFDSICYDDPLFLDNPNVKNGLSTETIRWAFTDATSISNYWIPVTWISFIVDCQIFDGNPGGFHFTSTIFHLLNSVLLYIFCLKIFKSSIPSTITAFLFAAHPLHVESVAWITCRKDLLCAFFWISALIVYNRYIQKKSWAIYWMTFLLFLLSFMSKPMAVTLPFVMLLLDVWPYQRIAIGSHDSIKATTKAFFYCCFEKIPFLIVMVLFASLTYSTQKSGNVLTTSTDDFSIPLRFFNLFVAYSFYLEKFLFPVDLSLLYPIPNRIEFIPHAISFLLIVSSTLFLLLHHKKHLNIIFGWLWFLGTLIPVSGIVIVGVFLYADRYAYIPMIGIYMIISGILTTFIQNHPGRKKITYVCLGFAALTLISTSWIQTTYWKNSITLFHRVTDIHPNSSIAYNNLGYAYKQRGYYQEASFYFQKAIDQSPKYFLPYFNLAGVYHLMGQYAKAIAYYNQSIARNPDAMSYFNLGLSYWKSGYNKEAITLLKKTLELEPNHILAKKYFAQLVHQRQSEEMD